MYEHFLIAGLSSEYIPKKYTTFYSSKCFIIYSQKEWLISIPIAECPDFRATFIVVPLPAKGSKTTPSGGQPISKHRDTNSSGYGRFQFQSQKDAE